MMNLRVIILVAFVNILFLPKAYSQMFTCQAVDGSKIFSDKPCHGNGNTFIKRGSVPVNVNVQESDEIRRFMAVSERKAAERKMRITEKRNQRQAAERHAAEQQVEEKQAAGKEVSESNQRPKRLVKIGSGGYVDPGTGRFYPRVGSGGVVDTQTGKYIPKH